MSLSVTTLRRKLRSQMLSRLALPLRSGVFKAQTRSLSLSLKTAETDEWFVFPRETEGNQYNVNWSLVEDGVTPRSEAFRNARLPILAQHLPTKIGKDNKLELSSPPFAGGKVEIKEAGDNITHEAFNASKAKTCDQLSAASTLFVEDATLGTSPHEGQRLGVRVVTSSPAWALLARSLLHPTPDRPPHALARARGWTQDPRIRDTTHTTWSDATHHFVHTRVGDLPALAGQRPVLVLLGEGTSAGVQYLSGPAGATGGGEVVGATITLPHTTPVRDFLSYVGEASSVVLNGSSTPVVSGRGGAVWLSPSTTALLLNFPEEVFEEVLKGLGGATEEVLYARDYVTWSPEGVGSVFGGTIVARAQASGGSEGLALPALLGSGDKGVRVLSPSNLAPPPSKVVVYAAEEVSGGSAEEVTVKGLAAWAGGAPEEVLRKLAQGTSVLVVRGAEEARAALKKK